MIICFDCTADTKKILDELLAMGEFKDHSEAINLALANQLLLQQKFDGDQTSLFPNDLSKRNGTAAFSKTTESQVRRQNLGRTPVVAGNLPLIFSLEGLSEAPNGYPDYPLDPATIHPGNKIFLDQWLFGQYNRLLPAKASCRALAHMLGDKPGGVSISEAASHISEEAIKLGDFFANHDNKIELERDEKLSTAFPSSFTNNVEKARARYEKQFVGSVNKAGVVSSLIISLKLANQTSEKTPKILLTKKGWEFALLPNPALEGPFSKRPDKLSREEIELLLSHIRENVPVEYFAYTTLLSIIRRGSDTPEAIDKALQDFLPNQSPNDLSQGYISSQRSGALSRMADLGLIFRKRDGVRVTYMVQEQGLRFLEGK